MRFAPFSHAATPSVGHSPPLHRFELDSPRPRHVCYALTQPTVMFAVGAFGGGCPVGGKVGQFSGG